MKYLSLLFCATLLAVAAPASSARADVSVSVDFFYDALSPYGDWVYTDNYGYVWQPANAQQAGWAPYSDGYWAYTDAGWTWISNEDYGWATYHYGRWIRLAGDWFWVPGDEWAPAWVSWRQSDDYVGWAPLPPEARWSSTIGFSTWTDSYYDIGPSYYSFVPMHSFATRSSLRPFIVDRRQNVTYIDRSVNITNISYRQNVVNNIFVGGPDPARIDRFGDNRIRRLTLRRDDDGFRRNWLDNDRNRGPRDGRDFRSLSRIESDQLVVAAPSVRRENTPGLPPRVRERLESPEVDRGWRNLGDPAMAERLRGRQREDLAKGKGEKRPEKTPELVTGKAPPPAVGRPLKPEERRDTVQRPAPGRVDEEVRKAEPQRGSTTTPPRVADEPPSRPGMPAGPGARRPEDQRPDGGRAETNRPGGRPGSGDRPEDRSRPMRPGEGAPGRGSPQDNLGRGPKGNDLRPVPPGVVPNEGGDRRRGGMPANPEQPPTNPEPRVAPPVTRPEPPRGADRRPDGNPEGRRPQRPDTLNPPRSPSIPMPEARPETRVRPAPTPRPEVPRAAPAPMPRPTPPTARPSLPQPSARPAMPERSQPQARPQPSAGPPQSRPSGPPPSGGGERGGGRGRGGPGGPGGDERRGR